MSSPAHAAFLAEVGIDLVLCEIEAASRTVVERVAAESAGADRASAVADRASAVAGPVSAASPVSAAGPVSARQVRWQREV